MGIPKSALNNPPTNPSSKAEKVTWLRLLFAIEYAYPADRVTKRSRFIVHLKSLISCSPGSGRPGILKLPSF